MTTEVPAASRVLEAADLPLCLILDALALRPLALGASTCKLWLETGQERLSLARPDKRRAYTAQRSFVAHGGGGARFGTQACTKGSRLLVFRAYERALTVQRVVGGAPDEWRCLLEGPKRILCMAADAEWVVCGGTFGELLVWRLPPVGAADGATASALPRVGGCVRGVYQALQYGTGLRGGLYQPHEGAGAHRVHNDVSCVAVRDGTIVSSSSSELVTWSLPSAELQAAELQAAERQGIAGPDDGFDDVRWRRAACAQAHSTLCLHLTEGREGEYPEGGEVLCGAHGELSVRAAGALTLNPTPADPKPN